MGRARSTRSLKRRADGDALFAAARLLAARPRSREALARLLAARGFSPAQTAEAVRRCVELGYLDERALAQSQARALLADGWAPAAIALRLAAQKLPEDAVRDALAFAVRELEWSAPQAARALVARRRLAGAGAVRLLLARGFDEAVARRAGGFDEE